MRYSLCLTHQPYEKGKNAIAEFAIDLFRSTYNFTTMVPTLCGSISGTVHVCIEK